ncbi:MAG: hypothetical protein RLZZ387_1236 [Chloroflexota bacterium]
MTRHAYRKQHPILAPALGYLALTLIVFAPILPHLTSAIPGGPVANSDGWQNVWNLWWVHKAVAALQNPFYTTYLYHPHGTPLYLQTLNASNGLLVLPVTALLGPVAGYNVALLLAFTLCGIGAYLLALRVSGSRVAAFVGGAIFAFSPFHLTKAWDGQLEQIAIQWVAFYALFLLRAAEDFRRRDAFVAGLFLALIGYTSWYYFFFFAIYTAIFALIWLAAARSWLARRRITAQFVITALSGALALAPILLPALVAVRAGRSAATPEPPYDPNNPLDLILIHSANLYDIFLPSGLHPLWGGAVEALVREWHPYIAAWNVSLGYTALALALAGLVLARGDRRPATDNPQPTTDDRRSMTSAAAPSSSVPRPCSSLGRSPWPWALIALAALVLSLGPLLHVGSLRTGVPLPYALLLSLPGADIARRPSHFVVIAVLMLAPLTALGLRVLLERLPTTRRTLALVTVAALLLIEYFPPAWPLHLAAQHPYYARLRGDSGALIDLPARPESAEPLRAQIVHELPVVGGYVSRLPYYPFVWTVPGVRQLWAGQPDERALLPERPDDGLVAMSYYGVRHVVVHWDALGGRARRQMEAALTQALPGVAPVYADERLSAYRLPETASRPLTFFGDGWFPEERDGERRWRWMTAEGSVVFINPSDLPQAVELRLAAQSFHEPREVTLLLGSAPLGTWGVGADVSRRVMRLLVPPGEHRLVLRAPAEREPVGERVISIVLVDVAVRWPPDQGRVAR